MVLLFFSIIVQFIVIIFSEINFNQFFKVVFHNFKIHMLNSSCGAIVYCRYPWLSLQIAVYGTTYGFLNHNGVLNSISIAY